MYLRDKRIEDKDMKSINSIIRAMELYLKKTSKKLFTFISIIYVCIKSINIVNI